MAVPAEPILASSIWLSQKRPPANRTAAVLVEKSRLSTGDKGIDKVLRGGLEYGSIHSITSDTGQDTTRLVQALLVSHLSSSSNAKASVIDSTLSFDVRRLYQSLESSFGGEQYTKGKAMEILENLNIMKVFDYMGLTEAVAEVRESLEHPTAIVPTAPAKQIPKSTIEDSEDEDEMLDSLSSAPGSPSGDCTAAAAGMRCTGLLIIDDITQIMAPGIKNNYTQGQALLASFMGVLGHVTRTHNLCTVLMASSNHKMATAEEALSIFNSCTIQPGLGARFGYLVDVQIYVHSLPKEPSSVRKGDNGELVSILEVVQDRYDGRVGHWAAFAREEDS